MALLSSRGAAPVAVPPSVDPVDADHAGPDDDVLVHHRLNQLLSRSGLGDEAAFAELYDATSRPIFTLVRSRTGSLAEAEHLTQQVYVRLWSEAVSYDIRAGRHAWCCLITLVHDQLSPDQLSPDQLSHDKFHPDQPMSSHQGTRDADLVGGLPR